MLAPRRFLPFLAVASGVVMVESSRPASTKAKKPLTEDDWRKILEEVDERFGERAERERLSWLNRPRIHTALIEDVVIDENLAKFIADKKINFFPASDAIERQ